MDENTRGTAVRGDFRNARSLLVYSHSGEQAAINGGSKAVYGSTGEKQRRRAESMGCFEKENKVDGKNSVASLETIGKCFALDFS
jgi:hypothetical protein